MEQVAISVRGRELSWLDFGGPGPVLLALHGSFGRASIFAPIADRLRGRVRLVALDQRGHWSVPARRPVHPRRVRR